jgi:AraC-like DNA-binding protein
MLSHDPAFAPPVPTGCFRVGPVQSFLDLLAQFGCPAGPLLARLGLGEDALTAPDAVMSYRDGAALVAQAVEATRCAHFGLLIGQRSNLASIGLVGRLAATEPSVREALRVLVRYYPLFDRGSTLALRVQGSDAVMHYGLTVIGLPAANQVYDLVLAVICNVLRDLCGPAWTPRLVTLPHNTPADGRPFRTCFRGEVRFNATSASVVFDAAWLARPPAASSAMSRPDLLRHVTEGEARLALTTAEQVRTELRAALPGHWLGEAEVATRLSIDRSTLRRRLAREGCRFRDVADGLRMETARQFLATSALDCGDIALVLGYSEPSAFARAFRRAVGASPTAWRRANTSRHA